MDVQSKNVSKNLSRFKVLSWVNEKMNAHILKVEELCTGAVYCQLMDMLFPDTVQLKRIKFLANHEKEFEHNFKLLQASFQKKLVRKEIPIERLVKGRFKDNFEFLLWFYNFFNVNFMGQVYNASVACNGAFMGYGVSVSLKSLDTRASFGVRLNKECKRPFSCNPKKDNEADSSELQVLQLERNVFKIKMLKVKQICEVNQQKHGGLTKQILGVINDDDATCSLTL